jgi:hypothetical protein
MADNVVVFVLGNRNSGKSTTWNALFGSTVKTGLHIRRLYFDSSEYVEVFLVSGSPEERETYVGEIVGQQRPRVILCSIQYRADVTRTIDFFLQEQYGIYAQWLNPGFSDSGQQADSLSLVSFLLDRGAVVSIRDGTVPSLKRVQEMREFLYGWAHSRGLVLTLQTGL